MIGVATLYAVVVAWFRPLEYDEVFTYYVSKLASFGQIYRALANGADDHPPLDYWLRHASLTLFGVSDFSLRIPSILAFTGCLLCVYALLRSALGTACALSAVGVVLLSKISAASYVGRSYMLIALATAGSLLAWRCAADGRHRKLALVVVALLFFCGLGLHYYALFHLFAICVAELVRSLRNKRIDWAMWIAFSAGLLSLPVVWPLLSVATAYVGHFWTPVSLRLTLDYYPQLLGYGTGAAVAFLIFAALIKPGEDKVRAYFHKNDLWPERAAAVYLVLLPFIIFAAGKLTHGMQSKYSISLPIGAAMLIACAVARSQRLRCVAAITFGSLGILSLPLAATGVLRNESPAAYLQSIYRIVQASSLPVAVDNPHTFVLAVRYAPSDLQKRLFYLNNIDTAVKLQGNDTDDRAIAGFSTIAPMQAIPEEDFLRNHQTFLLLHDGGWLVRDLLHRGAALSVVASDVQLVLKVNRKTDGGSQP